MRSQKNYQNTHWYSWQRTRCIPQFLLTGNSEGHRKENRKLRTENDSSRSTCWVRNQFPKSESFQFPKENTRSNHKDRASGAYFQKGKLAALQSLFISKSAGTWPSINQCKKMQMRRFRCELPIEKANISIVTALMRKQTGLQKKSVSTSPLAAFQTRESRRSLFPTYLLTS